MRLLTVRHITTYRYSEPVRFGEHRMMFRPRESHDLRLVNTTLAILPRPSTLRWLHDVFDNSVAIANFDEPAASLRFDSSVTLEHTEIELPSYPLESGACTYPFSYSEEERPDLVRALARQFPDDDLSAWTARFLKSPDPHRTLTLLRSITNGIRRELVYLQRHEKGVQRPSETLRRGSGSCRDFAVLMIEALRSLGIAARFVSGYIFVPSLDIAHVVSGGATHGWLQAYLPGAGWVDFDPTNSIVGNRNLIRVTVALDQRSALPLWGTFTGKPSSFLGMDVEVSVSEQQTPAPTAYSR
jgi:transglutaminase-like putative cysteine protease